MTDFLPDLPGPLPDLDNVLPFIPGIGPVITGGSTAASAPDLLKKDKHRRLSQVLTDNGWPTSVVPTARQVAVAESRGNPNAKGDGGPILGWNGRPTSIGLFMVRGFDNKGNRVHAGKAGSPTDYDGYVKWAQDPDNNARLALVVWKEAGNSFAPWTVFKTGAYKLSGNRDPLITKKQSLGVDDIPVVGDVVDAAGSVVNIAGDFFDLITDRNTWFRVGKGFVGLNLITLGFIGLIAIALKDPIKQVVKSSTRVAGKTAVGKAANLAIPKV